MSQKLKQKVAQATGTGWKMFLWTVGSFTGAYYLADNLMKLTAMSPEKEEELRRNMSMNNQVLSRVNKERLGVMLREIKEKNGDEERYRAALDGKSLGTHMGGTTVDARAIRDKE